MSTEDFSRREWVAAWSLGLMAAWPEVTAAQEHAHRAVQSGSKEWSFFDAAAAADIEAICAQIIPTDETPGAREAGVIHFIDRALVTFDKDRQNAYRQGLAEVRSKCASLFPGSTAIAALPADQQLALVTAIDGTPFFELVRTHTMLGFFGSPDRGGNRDLIGWKLLGMDGKMSYQAPFGYYDAQAMKDGGQ